MCRVMGPVRMQRAGQHSIRINEIVHGTRRITADTALRLGRFFGTSAQFWVNLQSHYDLEVELDALGDELTRIQPLHSA